MTRLAILCGPALALLVAGPSLSEEPIANRFTLEKTENGFVRMDTRTGEMSICTEQSGNIVCRLSADERRAYDESLAELSARVAALEQRIELMDPPSAIAKDPDQGPDEAELDRAVDAMEKVMRRFFGMVEELRRDFGDKPQLPPEPVPDRT